MFHWKYFLRMPHSNRGFWSENNVCVEIFCQIKIILTISHKNSCIISCVLIYLLWNIPHLGQLWLHLRQTFYTGKILKHYTQYTPGKWSSQHQGVCIPTWQTRFSSHWPTSCLHQSLFLLCCCILEQKGIQRSTKRQKENI